MMLSIGLFSSPAVGHAAKEDILFFHDKGSEQLPFSSAPAVPFLEPLGCGEEPPQVGPLSTHIMSEGHDATPEGGNIGFSSQGMEYYHHPMGDGRCRSSTISIFDALPYFCNRCGSHQCSGPCVSFVPDEVMTSFDEKWIEQAKSLSKAAVGGTTTYSLHRSTAKSEQMFLDAAHAQALSGEEIASRMFSRPIPLNTPLPYSHDKYIKDITRLCLEECVPFHSLDEIAYASLFIDGGYDSTFAVPHSWGAAIMFEDTNGLQCLYGSASGQLNFNPASLLYLGQAEDPSAYVSELYAQMIAKLLIVQYFPRILPCRGTPIYVVYDNMSAAITANSCKITDGQPTLSAACHVVDMIVSLMFTNVKYEHVYSHDRHPWNELADSLCTHARNIPEACNDSIPGAPFLPSHFHDLELYVTVRFPSIAAQLITADDWEPGDVQAFSPDLIAEHFDCAPSLTDAEKSEVRWSAVLNFVQYNVFTLTMNRSTLSSKLRKAKVFCSFIQEGRSKAAGITQDSSFVYAVSEATQYGSHGCEVWISRSIPLSDSYPVKVCQDDLSIMDHNPRILVVRMVAACFSAVLISAHAPYVTTPDTIPFAMQWHSEFVARVNEYHSKYSVVIVGLDGNFTLSQYGNMPLQFGTAFSGNPSKHAQFVKEVYSGCELRFVTTLKENCKPTFYRDPYTYHIKTGTHVTTNDYILAPAAGVLVVPKSTNRVTSLSTRHDAHDHHPVIVSMYFRSSDSDNLPFKRRVADYHRLSIGDPAKDAKFLTMLRQCPPCCYELDASSHYYVIRSYIHDAACSAYPMPPKPKHNSHITDFSFSYIIKHGSALHEYYRVMDLSRKRLVFVIFKAWSTSMCYKWHWLYGFHRKATLVRLNRARANLKLVSKQTKSVMQLEKLAKDLAQTERLEHAAQEDNIFSMYSYIRNYTAAGKKKSSTRSSRVVSLDGSLASSREEEQIAFRNEFSQQLSGAVMPFSELVLRDRIDASKPLYILPDESSYSGSTPRVTDLESAFSKKSKGKAFGEGRLAAELFKRFPRDMAKVYFPLAFKSYARLLPPLQWRGGMAVFLFKGKGDPAIPNAYREVILADDCGKALASVIRTRVFPLLSKVASPTQYGSGLSGGETTFAHLACQLFVDTVKGKHISGSLLFVDIVAAFASCLRKIVYMDPENEEQWAKALKTVGISDEDITDLLTALNDAVWLEEHEDHHTSKSYDFVVSAGYYRNSWFSVEGLKGIVRTTRGAGAGTPLADVMFALVMARVVHVLSHQIDEAGLAPTVSLGRDSSVKFRDISYHDDLVLPIVAPAHQLVDATAKAASIVFYVFAMFGFSLNFTKGKTEAIIVFAGPGSIKARTDLFKSESSVPVDVKLRGIHLRFVPNYKHLGTHTNISASPAEEVAFRMALMRADVHKLRKVMNQPLLPVTRKLSIATAYLLTKGTYNVSTWPELTAFTMSKFHTGIMRIYRAATSNLYIPGGERVVLSDDAILDEFSLLSPTALIRLSRMSLLLRIVKKSSSYLLYLLRTLPSFKGGWMSLVQKDIDLMSQHEHLAPLAGKDVSQAIDIFATHPKEWFNKVRRILRSPFFSLDLAGVKVPKNRSSTHEHICYRCSKPFATYQQLALHMFKSHGIKNPIGRFIDDTVCPLCLKQFHNRERALNHVRYRSLRCRLILFQRGPIMSQAECDRLDEACCEQNKKLYASGRRRHHASVTCLRVEGPLPSEEIFIRNNSHNRMLYSSD